VQTNDELQKLRRLERAHNRSQSNLIRSREYAQRRAIVLARDIGRLEQAVDQVVSTSGDDFAIQLSTDGGYGRSWERHTKRTDAAHAVGQWAQQARLAARSYSGSLGEVAKIGAFTVVAELVAVPGTPEATVKFSIDGIPDAEAAATRRDVLAGNLGVVTRLENLQASIPTILDRTRELLTENELNLADAEQRIGQSFKHTEQLAEVQARADAITAQLVEQERGPETSAPSQRKALVSEIRTDEWWKARQAADVRQLLDDAGRTKEQDSDSAALYGALSAEIRRRYPESVARHFGVEAPPEGRTGHDSRSDTGPVLPSTAEGRGPSLR
jgi:hypothetical protein